MKLEWIEYFVGIAKTESLTKTADSFYLSQPTMSKAIRNLEEELGVDLFYRKKTGMYLTEQGEMFLPYAEKIVDQYQLYRKTAIDQTIACLEEIEIVVSPHLLQSYYEEIYQILSKFAPKSRISIIDVDNVKAREMVINNPKTIGLIAADSAINKEICDSDLQSVALYDTPLVLCMSKTSRLAGKEHIVPSDLNGDDILALTADTAQRNVMISKTILKTSNLQLLMNMLVAEKGICVLPQKIAEKSFDKASLMIRPVDFLEKVTITFVYNTQAINEGGYSKIVLDKLSREFAEIFYGNVRVSDK